jgi:hypothetical protein
MEGLSSLILIEAVVSRAQGNVAMVVELKARHGPDSLPPFLSTTINSICHDDDDPLPTLAHDPLVGFHPGCPRSSQNALPGLVQVGALLVLAPSFLPLRSTPHPPALIIICDCC